MTRLFSLYHGAPLMDQICSVPNMTVAWQKVKSNIHVGRRGKSAGVDAITLREFEADWPNQMAILQDELMSGLYRPLPPRHVEIPKASGSMRVIAILAVRDRVAQRAVKQVLEPLFDPLLHDCSFGCRQRVGVPDALTMVTRYADRGLTWVVDADIASYFDAIDHRILMSLVRQRIDEVRVLQMITRWLEVGTLTDEDARAYVDDVKEQGHHRRPAHDAIEPTGSESDLLLAHGAMYDPYGITPWQQGDVSHGLLNNRLWSALALARPVLSGIQQALPHVQRVGKQIGVKRLAIAGAVAASAAGVAAAGELWRRQREKQRGAMQGGALSPLLANIYLHPFDLAMTTRGFRMVRFMDDFVIMCATREDAEDALQLAVRQLALLRLQVNEEKTRLVSYEDGLEFLGQALVPTQQRSALTQGLTSFAEAAERLKQLKRRKR